MGTLRATVISMLSAAGDPQVLQTGFEKFLEYKHDRVAIPGDLRESVFHCAMKHDEATTYTALMELYEQSSFPEEQRDCLTALGAVTDMSRHADMIDYVFHSGKVRLQDISNPLASLSGTTDEGGRAMWSYFCKNYSELKAKIGTSPVWSACVALSCRGLTTMEEAAEVKSFVSAHDPGSAKRRLSQVLEVVRTKVKRRERDRAVMAEYFAAY